MPILVVCSNCAAKLTAPDSAAGKKVKCAKCKTVCTVPPLAFEVMEDEPEPEPQPVPRTTPATAVAASARVDNDDEADDPPRKKKQAPQDDARRSRKRNRTDERPRKQQGRSQGMLLAGIVGGLLYIGVVVYSTYSFSNRNKAGGTNNNANNWVEQTKKLNDPEVRFEKLLDDLKQGKGRSDAYRELDNLPVREDRRAEVAKLLERGLTEAPDDLAKQYAAKGLGKWGSKENVPRVIRALEVSDNYVLINGVIPALVAIKDPAAIKPLVEKYEKFELMCPTLANTSTRVRCRG